MLQRATTTLKSSPLLKYLCVALSKRLHLHEGMLKWHVFSRCLLFNDVGMTPGWLLFIGPAQLFPELTTVSWGSLFPCRLLHWHDAVNLQKHAVQALLLDTSAVHLFEVRVPRGQAARVLSCRESIIFNCREKSNAKKPVLLHCWAAAVSKRAGVW